MQCEILRPLRTCPCTWCSGAPWWSSGPAAPAGAGSALSATPRTTTAPRRAGAGVGSGRRRRRPPTAPYHFRRRVFAERPDGVGRLRTAPPDITGRSHTSDDQEWARPGLGPVHANPAAARPGQDIPVFRRRFPGAEGGVRGDRTGQGFRMRRGTHRGGLPGPAANAAGPTAPGPAAASTRRSCPVGWTHPLRSGRRDPGTSRRRATGGSVPARSPVSDPWTHR